VNRGLDNDVLLKKHLTQL